VSTGVTHGGTKRIRSDMRAVAIHSLLLVGCVAMPCCGVAPQGVTVNFGHQKNIVVWDKVNRIEHFVRVSAFEGQTEKFGFIAPTPSIPTISQVDPKAFEALLAMDEAIRNPVRTTVYAGHAGDGAPVRVVQRVRVGDYLATTFQASDGDALEGYLAREGFALTPDSEKWVAHYVAKAWYLTAFRIEKQEGVLDTGAICMSFATERPFNPAYVPADNLRGRVGGGYHLYLVAPDYAERGTIGDRKVSPTNRFELQRPERINEHLKQAGVVIPDGYQVTVFEEKFRPTDHDDLYFKFEQSAAVGFPRIGCLSVLAFALVGGWVRARLMTANR